MAPVASAFVRMFEAMPKGQAIAAGLAGAFILTEISNTILCSGGEKVSARAVLQPPRPPRPAAATASSASSITPPRGWGEQPCGGGRPGIPR